MQQVSTGRHDGAFKLTLGGCIIDITAVLVFYGERQYVPSHQALIHAPLLRGPGQLQHPDTTNQKKKKKKRSSCNAEGAFMDLLTETCGGWQLEEFVLNMCPGAMQTVAQRWFFSLLKSSKRSKIRNGLGSVYQL